MVEKILLIHSRDGCPACAHITQPAVLKNINTRLLALDPKAKLVLAKHGDTWIAGETSYTNSFQMISAPTVMLVPVDGSKDLNRVKTFNYHFSNGIMQQNKVQEKDIFNWLSRAISEPFYADNKLSDDLADGLTIIEPPDDSQISKSNTTYRWLTVKANGRRSARNL